MGSIVKGFRSLWTLGRLTGQQLAQAVWCLLRGDRRGSAEHVRAAMLYVHNDLLQVVVALQGRLPFWKAPERASVDRVLIVKLDRIGDMVTTMPVFDALRRLFPEARLDIVAHPAPLSLLEGDPRVGERIAYRSWIYHALPIVPAGPRSLWTVARLLWRRYPLVVYLRGSAPFLALGLTSRLSATKFLVGEPVIDRYLKPLEALYGPIEERQPTLHIEDGVARKVREMLERVESSGGPRIAIHAGASTSTKVWPSVRYARLADELARRYQARVHFLGSVAEREGLERIADLARGSHSYHWYLRLPETVALIAQCDLFIGNDSGLSHVAAAVDVPAVVLWGPVNLSMARPKASPERCVILYHDIPCRETCVEFRCLSPNPLECLTRTGVEDVLDAAGPLLESNEALARS